MLAARHIIQYNASYADIFMMPAPRWLLRGFSIALSESVQGAVQMLTIENRATMASDL